MLIKIKNKKIWTVYNKEEESFLRSRVPDFNFSNYSKKEMEEIIQHMRIMMVLSYGVGLSANQIGIDRRIFVCQLPSADGRGYKGKFFAIINPIIVKESKKEVLESEGCLSVPKTYGDVLRPYKIKMDAHDQNGKNISIKADGLLARIFQHETDHLNGTLFTDKAENIIQENEL